MKKYKKNCHYDWTSIVPVTILCALCFGSQAVCAVDEAPSPATESVVRLEELRLERDDAQMKATQLQVELGRVQRQLDAVRREYARLLVEAKAQAGDLSELQLRVSELLVGHADAGALEAYEALSQVRQRHLSLYREVREFGDYLEAVLEVIQPSEVLEQEMVDRHQRLVREIDRLERMPSLVAGRGGNEPRALRQCRVLAVNDDLQVVVLNAGRNDGVYPGSAWYTTEDSVVSGRLTVIESRPTVSAAVPTEGDLRRFAPGVVVQLERETREE